MGRPSKTVEKAKKIAALTTVKVTSGTLSAPAVVSDPIKKYVKKMLDERIEDKVIMTDLVAAVGDAQNLVITPNNSTLPLYFSLIPTISQGDGLQQRTGTEIRVKKHIIRCSLFLTYGTVTGGVDVPMNIFYFVLNTKDSPDSLNQTDLNNLFYTPSGAGPFLSGSGYATNHHLNRDYFNIWKTNYPHKPIKLGWAAGQGDTDARSANNDYSANYKFMLDLTNKTNKRIHFSNTGTAPTNLNAYLVIYVQKISLDVVTDSWDPPRLFVTQEIYYEDA